MIRIIQRDNKVYPLKAISIWTSNQTNRIFFKMIIFNKKKQRFPRRKIKKETTEKILVTSRRESNNLKRKSRCINRQQPTYKKTPTCLNLKTTFFIFINSIRTSPVLLSILLLSKMIHLQSRISPRKSIEFTSKRITMR